jgi:hypothetical protein
MIMNLSERTADAAIYILSGELPLELFIHSQILLKLCSIIRYGGIEKELCVRQVLIKELMVINVVFKFGPALILSINGCLVRSNDGHFIRK